jgi:hypothetical protein
MIAVCTRCGSRTLCTLRIYQEAPRALSFCCVAVVEWVRP